MANKILVLRTPNNVKSPRESQPYFLLAFEYHLVFHCSLEVYIKRSVYISNERRQPTCTSTKKMHPFGVEEWTDIASLELNNDDISVGEVWIGTRREC